MQIVINISEEDYKGLKRKDKFNDMFLNYYEKLIVYGTPLPKGHGDLVDFDRLCEEYWNGNYMEIHKDDLSNIKPIIEKDGD